MIENPEEKSINGVIHVTIPMEDWLDLAESYEELLALHNFGVDHWSNYDEAMASLSEDYDEDEKLAAMLEKKKDES